MNPMNDIIFSNPVDNHNENKELLTLYSKDISKETLDLIQSENKEIEQIINDDPKEELFGTIAKKLEEAFEEKHMMFGIFILENFYSNYKNTRLFPKFIEYLLKNGFFYEPSINFWANNIEMYKKSFMKSLEEALSYVLQNSGSSSSSPDTQLLIFRDIKKHISCLDEGDFLVNTSRFQSEFTEIEKIGEGGFGDVVKVKNKLDGGFYAIKKIRFRDKGVRTQQVLREVKALARLDHPNVCRYYHAWIEPYVENQSVNLKHKFRSHSRKKSLTYDKPLNENIYIPRSNSIAIPKKASNNKENNNNPLSISIDSVQKNFFIEDEEYNNDFSFSFNNKKMDLELDLQTKNDNGDSIVEFQSLQSDSFSNIEETSLSDNEINKQPIMGICNYQKSRHQPSLTFTLYIQMQLYETKTLKHWLEHNNQIIDIKRNLKIFKEICEGLEHIHKCGIIHRDIKPANIFISTDGTCKIGDFGLAKELGDDNLSPSQRDPIHSSGVGTTSYGSPEQLTGENYDFKSDIYSLGIVLFELFSTFKTKAERAHAFRKLKQDYILPEEILQKFPEIAEVVLWLISKNPSDRPSASAILAHSLFEKHNEINLLRKQLTESELTIQQQAARIKELEEKLKNHHQEVNNDNIN